MPDDNVFENQSVDKAASGAENADAISGTDAGSERGFSSRTSSNSAAENASAGTENASVSPANNGSSGVQRGAGTKTGSKQSASSPGEKSHDNTAASSSSSTNPDAGNAEESIRGAQANTDGAHAGNISGTSSDLLDRSLIDPSEKALDYIKPATTHSASESSALHESSLADASNAGRNIGSTFSRAASGFSDATGSLLNYVGQGVVHAGRAFTSAVRSFVTNGVATMTSAIGTTGAVLATTTVVAVGAAGGIAVYQTFSYDTAKLDDLIVEEELCKTDIAEESADALNAYSDMEYSEAQKESASKIYSVMKSIGWKDEWIAGLLGCIECECGMDPTCIEYMELSEPAFQWTDAKAALFNTAANDVRQPEMNNWVEKTLAATSGTDDSVYRNNGNGCVGIGILQWTGESAIGFLEYVQKYQTVWYSLDIQLQYIADEYRHDYFYNPTDHIGYNEQAKDTFSLDSVGDCADWCEWYITGHHNKGDSARRDAAERWFATLSELNYDASYASGILASCASTMDAATQNAIDEAMEACEEEITVNADNSDLVHAAIAMAWPTRDQAVGNNGTELYQQVLKAVGDATGRTPTYRACSDFTYAVILWSGTDDEFSKPPCEVQLNTYLTGGQTTWKYIGTMDDDRDKLEPGDLIISSGHTYIWVGHDAIAEQYPDADSNLDCVMASLDSDYSQARSAALQSSYNHDVHGEVFQIWRCVRPTGEASKYKHLLD